MIEALAGSGKTFTKRMMISSIPKGSGRILSTAFQKNVVDYDKTILPSHVDISSLHSVGFAAVRTAVRPKYHPKYVNENKYFYILYDYIKRLPKAVNSIGGMASVALPLLQKMMVEGEEPTIGGIERVADRYDLLVPLGATACSKMFHHALGRGEAEAHRWVDFNDMLYLPMRMNLHVPRYDYIFVDEAQDLSKVQIELLMRAHKGGRMVCVGDSRQSIFGFGGALPGSMDTMCNLLQADVYPLPICYRCPASHVELAQRNVPQLEVAPGAKAGTIVLDATHRGWEWKPGDLVICRVTKHVVSLAWYLLRRKVPVTVLGRGIGQGIVNLVNHVTEYRDDINLYDVAALVEDYCMAQEGRLREKKATDLEIENLHDRCESILVLHHAALTEGMSVAEFKQMVTDLFSDDDSESRVVLSTIHRAKGSERDRIIHLMPSLIPHAKARMEWELEQEKNLRYVSDTRSRDTLAFMENI